jgi:hypothetical protein
MDDVPSLQSSRMTKNLDLQKRYWIISSAPTFDAINGKIEIKLPVFFTNSMSPHKYIEVRHCKVIYKDTLVNDIKFHSNIVNEDPFDDYFICFTNEVLVKPKKYQWYSSNKTINIWFTNMQNEPVDIIYYHVDILLMF